MQPMLTWVALGTISIVMIGFAVLLVIAYQHGRYK